MLASYAALRLCFRGQMATASLSYLVLLKLSTQHCKAGIRARRSPNAGDADSLRVQVPAGAVVLPRRPAHRRARSTSATADRLVWLRLRSRLCVTACVCRAAPVRAGRCAESAPGLCGDRVCVPSVALAELDPMILAPHPLPRASLISSRARRRRGMSWAERLDGRRR